MRSSRVAFVVVALITVILLAGSVLLQRVVFKAAESEASVYLSPSNFIVRPAGEVNLNVVSNFSITAFVAAAQVTAEYDEQTLSFQSVLAADGFETKKLTASNGKVSWLLVPSSIQGKIGHYSGITTVGQIKFNAVGSGSTTISLNPEESIISAIDPQGSTALYNAVNSTQGSAGEITQLAASGSVGEQLPPSSEQTSILTTQRITHSNVIPLANRALIAVQLRSSAKVEVEFGSSANLGSVVTAAQADTSHLLAVEGLSEKTKYFYRLSVLSASGKKELVLPIRTFTSSFVGSGRVSASQSQLVAQAPQAVETTELVFVGRDSAGGLVSVPAEFKVAQGEVIVEAIAGSDPIRATVTPLTTAKQEVVIQAFAAGEMLGTVKLSFDPAAVQAAQYDRLVGGSLPFDRSTQLSLAALLAIIALSTYLLIRLLKLQ